MATQEPYLFRFKRECISPSRSTPSQDYHYDSSLCQVVVMREGLVIPAIDSDDDDGPKTKKADIEKGEDQKDRRGWF